MRLFFSYDTTFRVYTFRRTPQRIWIAIGIKHTCQQIPETFLIKNYVHTNLGFIHIAHKSVPLTTAMVLFANCTDRHISQ